MNGVTATSEHYAIGLARAFDGAIVFGMPLYIPGHSARPGGLFFPRAPRAGTLPGRSAEVSQYEMRQIRRSGPTLPFSS